jgi:hypothetical protein
MLQNKAIEVGPVVAAAQRAFCTLLHAYTGTPDASTCANRHSCKYAQLMVQGGGGAEHHQLPIPAYVSAIAPLGRKRALARLRLSSSPIQTNLLQGTAGEVPYSDRKCTRGCVAMVDSEQHMLFDCIATEDARSRYSADLDLAAGDFRGLMDKVYQQDTAISVMNFVYYASNLLSGPTA